MAALLVDAGHDAIHVGAVGLLGRPDAEVMAAAGVDDRVVLSADTDFGELLARSRERLPSVVLLRRNPHSAEQQVAIVLAALIDVTADLEGGAMVIVDERRVRIRPLPIGRDGGSAGST